jgi:hypothetical protein
MVMPLSSPYSFLFVDTPIEALRPIALGLGYYFSDNYSAGT